MTQIFSNAADLTSFLTLLVLVVTVVAVLVTWHASLGAQARLIQPVDQPVPFSHPHHAADPNLHALRFSAVSNQPGARADS